MTADPPLQTLGAGALIGLSIITFGIYGLVKFYRTGIAYQRLAGRPSNFVNMFWLQVVGGPIVSVILLAIGGVPGMLAYVGTIVIGVMVVLEVLNLRADLVRLRGLDVQLTSKGALAALWFCGVIPLVGIVTVILAVVFFCQDHNRVAAALTGRSPQ